MLFDLSQCYPSKSEIWYYLWNNNTSLRKGSLYSNFFKLLAGINCTVICLTSQRDLFRQRYRKDNAVLYCLFFTTVKLHLRSSTSTRSPWWGYGSQYHRVLELVELILMRRI